MAPRVRGKGTMIPKIIHYCWFGHGPKPEVFEKCLESWKKYMPDFQIIEWNEDNSDLKECKFLQDAYEQKKWAFVSDVVRLRAVYEMGGVYMDTDVELYEPLEEYLQHNAFFFFQNPSLTNSRIATGLGFGACKGNALLWKLLEDYRTSEFRLEDMTQLACPVKNTAVIAREYPQFQTKSQRQLIDNMLFIESETYHRLARHYGECSWMTDAQRQALRFVKKKHGFWRLKKVLRNPKIFAFLETHHMGAVSKIYCFLVQDLVDNGIVYWVVRCWQKVTGKG